MIEIIIDTMSKDRERRRRREGGEMKQSNMAVEKLANNHPERERDCDYRAFTVPLITRLDLCLNSNKGCNIDLIALISNFLLFLLLQALYNEYVHFKETEIPAKENEKGHIEHLYKLLEVRMNTLGEHY